MASGYSWNPLLLFLGSWPIFRFVLMTFNKDGDKIGSQGIKLLVKADLPLLQKIHLRTYTS